MARKKDLTGAITHGADRFFSANDELQETLNTQVTQELSNTYEEYKAHEVQEVQQPRKAQDIPKVQLKATVYTMQEQIEAAEARRTQGRKGLKMPKMNMAFTPSNYDYLRIMAGLNGMTITRFMNHIIEQHAAVNAERFQKAKELMRDE